MSIEAKLTNDEKSYGAVVKVVQKPIHLKNKTLELQLLWWPTKYIVKVTLLDEGSIISSKKWFFKNKEEMDKFINQDW